MKELTSLIESSQCENQYSRNLVAYASDGASVLRGNKNSVLRELKEKFPLIWDLHCPPHYFHLIANFASDKMPDMIENLVRKIYTHFAHFPRRLADWEDFQEEMNIKPYKILSYSTVRWSRIVESISRILVRWHFDHIFWR